MPHPKKRNSVIAFCLGIAAAGCLIQAAGWIRNDRLVFPEVSEILHAFGNLLSKKETWSGIFVTVQHLILSLLISTAAGLLLGFCQGLSDWLYSFFRPMMTFFRSMPMIVLTIVLMVMMNYTWVPVAAGALILIPLISEAVREGCRRIEPELIDVYRMNSSLTFSVLRNVYVPSVTGYLLQAFNNAAGMGMKIVVSAEYLVQTRNSLGKAVFTANYFNEYAEIYAYALILALLVILLSVLPALTGKAISRIRSSRGFLFQ